MALGISSYSLQRAMQAGEMDIHAVIAWSAEQGASHLEIVPMGPLQVPDAAAARVIAASAATHGLALSSYTIGADLLRGDATARQAEVERLRREVDIAHALGVSLMRHDAAWRPREQTDAATFDADLPQLVASCRAIAEHARGAGITTSVENHGFHVQTSSRLRRLVEAVDCDNFRMTVDVGNFLCADEDPVTALRHAMPVASMVHIKDFYIRDDAPQLGDWLQTLGDRRLRGAICGHGDIDLPAVLGEIVAAGYAGFLSLEFEGLEDCRLGTQRGFANLRCLWQQAVAAPVAS
jgi:sugar phosphate isomerase/epimerase